jgi:hypothetical protein
MVYLKNMTDILGDSTTNRHLILHWHFNDKASNVNIFFP